MARFSKNVYNSKIIKIIILGKLTAREKNRKKESDMRIAGFVGNPCLYSY
jgi:hypothetical protein